MSGRPRSVAELVFGLVDTYGEISQARLIERLAGDVPPADVRTFLLAEIGNGRLRINSAGMLEREQRVQVLVSEYLVSVLHWTSEKPTRRGWYWAKMYVNGAAETPEPVVIEITEHCSNRLIGWDGTQTYELDDPRIVAWSDRPIPEPVV